MNKKDEVIRLYAADGWKKWFALWRFWAAPYSLVERMIPKKGTIIELGCGEGLFSNYLAASSPKRKIIGIELDKERVTIAQKGYKNTKFIQGNALKVKLPSADCIILFHVLHHLKSFRSQEELIKKITKSLKKSGSLVIVEIDKDYTAKYYLTWFWDHFMVPWFFEKSFYQKDIFFRNRSDWKKTLANSGFTTTVTKKDDNMPFSHIVYVCHFK